MWLDKAMQTLKYDTRMTEYNVTRGVISESELQSHIQGLDDSESNALYFSIADKDVGGGNDFAEPPAPAAAPSGGFDSSDLN